MLDAFIIGCVLLYYQPMDAETSFVEIGRGGGQVLFMQSQKGLA